MAKVTARIKIKNKHYETKVDLDEALKVKEGKGDITKTLEVRKIFYDLDKGTVASQTDLQDAFGTIDALEIAEIIIKKGEVQKTQEFRDEEKEKKIKQVIAIILRNAVDQNGRPFTEERIKSAIHEVHYNFDNRPPEQQMNDLVHKLKTIIPIKIEKKKIKLTIPARYAAQTYSIIKDYKEEEEWLSNGDLKVIVSIPSGLTIDFYEKLNGVTHCAVQTEDMK